MKFAFALLACAFAASASGLDGDWNAELSPRGKNAAPVQSISFTLTLRTQDGQVTGMVTLPGKRKARLQSIQNAKLDGNTLTFTTLQTSKKMSVSFSWRIAVDGDRMSGTRTREGSRRGAAFKARKAA